MPECLKAVLSHRPLGHGCNSARRACGERCSGLTRGERRDGVRLVRISSCAPAHTQHALSVVDKPSRSTFRQDVDVENRSSGAVNAASTKRKCRCVSAAGTNQTSSRASKSLGARVKKQAKQTYSSLKTGYQQVTVLCDAAAYQLVKICAPRVETQMTRRRSRSLYGAAAAQAIKRH